MSGGKSKRRDIEKGRSRAGNAFESARDTQTPFIEQGAQADRIISSALGLDRFAGGGAGGGGGAPINTARNAFEQSPFFVGAENAFIDDKDAINAGLAAQGLLNSGARNVAIENARQDRFGQNFNNFFSALQGEAAQGFSGAGNRANAFGQQAEVDFGAGRSTANTRKGFLGGLKDISEIARNFTNREDGF